MADWRTRHYVPDSDDDEECDIDSQLSGSRQPGVGGKEDKRASTYNSDEPKGDGKLQVEGYQNINRASQGSSKGSSSQEKNSIDQLQSDILQAYEDEDSEDELSRPDPRNASLSVASSLTPLEDSSSGISLTQDRSLQVRDVHEDDGIQLEKELENHNVISDLEDAVEAGDPSLLDSQKLSLVLSSPLSELARSPSLPALSDDDDDDDRANTEAEDGHTTAATFARQASPEFQPPVRTFRARKPEQLNPYTVEDARHRKTFQQGGLKPIRYREASVEAERHRPRNTSPDTDYQEEESQIVRPQSQELAVSLDSSPPVVNSMYLNLEGDLPDLDSLLDSNNSDLRLARKRRKIHHRYSSKGMINSRNRLDRLPEVSQDKDNSEIIPISTENNGVPPSPPTSTPPQLQERTVQVQVPNFRYPPGMTTPRLLEQLQTPERTSELRMPSSKPRTFLNISDKESSEDDASPALEAAQSSESENDRSEVEFKEQSRRIKGVLPASYFRFTGQGQKPKEKLTKDNVQRQGKSPIKSTQRGIARPITSSESKHPRPMQKQVETFVVSDGEDILEHDHDTNPLELDLDSPTKRQRSPIGIRDSIFDTLVVDDDEMEDNSFDRMEPGQHRHRSINKQTPKFKKRKTNSSNLFKEPTRPRMVQPKISGHVKREKIRKRRSKKTDTRLSVADVIDADDLQSVPEFLRIAARTASARTDQGRHSPSRKVIRLTTVEENADVENLLEKWQRNQIPRPPRSVARARRPTGTSHSRRPLISTSGNQRSIKPWTNTPASTEKFIDTENHSKGDRPVQQAIKEILSNARSRASKLQPSSPLISKSEEDKRIRQILVSNSIGDTRNQPAVLEKLKANGKGGLPQQITRPKSSHQQRYPAGMQSNPVLERYLQSPTPAPTSSEFDQPLNHTDNRTLQRSRRKRTPKQVQITSVSLQQNQTLAHDDVLETPDLVDGPKEKQVNDQHTLSDLAPYGSDYTVDFDIKCLPRGSFFPDENLLGSGRFSRWIQQTTSRDMTTPQDPLNFEVDGVSFSWSAWTEVLSSEFVSLVGPIVTELRCGNVFDNWQRHCTVLTSVAEYLATHLFFLDGVDRLSFVTRLQELISELADAAFGYTEATVKPDQDVSFFQLFQQLMIVSWQVGSIGNCDLLQAAQTLKAKDVFLSSLRMTMKTILSEGISDFDKFLRAVHDYSSIASLSKTSLGKVETFVIGKHLARLCDSSKSVFLEVLRTGVQKRLSHATRSVRYLDIAWFSLFVLLPFDDIDEDGTVDPSKRHITSIEGWSLVQDLLRPVLDAYQSSSSTQGPTFNEYFRSVLGRCLHLIRIWRWIKCDQIIRQLYDFFSRNNLGDLNHESDRGIPKFLESLGKTPDLSFSKDDRSFTVFLKILSAGLLEMRQTLSDKKVQGLVYRVTPNHSRTLPKDEVVRQEDLDALRNHHSLLTVLYFASPPSRKPRLDTLRNLIHVEDSHREACHINMRAWSNLMNYELSQTASISVVEDLMHWYNSFLSQTIRQHKAARIEIEAHGAAISSYERESYITMNQRQIEAVLADALDSLKRAMMLDTTNEVKNVLLTTSLKEVFGLFDPEHPRVHSVIIKALDIIQNFSRVCISTATNETANTNDDSQDYGEWPSFEDDGEFGIERQVKTVDLQISRELYASVHSLLSDSFGAEIASEEALLGKIMDTWVALACLQVNTMQRSWDDYMNPYQNESWFVLRSTEQHSLYTPMYFARLLELAPDTYDEHQPAILHAWITSLVVRESQLKYQNLLTVALLRRDGQNPLLANLPFITDSNGDVEISIADLRSRRLSLISCILSNMRESLEFVDYHGISQRREQRQLYVDLLKALMKAMKQTYEGLGNGPDIQGLYVEFVQTVVSFLQQYTAEIWPIDKFFTDARTFPLPAHDPSYVVGRLKSYGLKLRDKRTAKGLVTFIQNVIERANIDGKENYLVDQLQTAISTTFEHGDSTRPTLRSYIIETIVPAYLGVALRSSCGWLLAAPLLQSLQGTMASILLVLDGADPQSCAGVAGTIGTLLSSIQRSVATLVEQGQAPFHSPPVIRILTIYYALVTACLRPLDYLLCLSPSAVPARAAVEYLASFAEAATERMTTVDQAQDQDTAATTRIAPSVSAVGTTTTATNAKGTASVSRRASSSSSSSYAAGAIDSFGPNRETNAVGANGRAPPPPPSSRFSTLKHGSTVVSNAAAPAAATDVAAYASTELKSTLEKSWMAIDDERGRRRYVYVANGGRKEIAVHLLGWEGERDRFLLQYRLFRAEIEHLPSLANGAWVPRPRGTTGDYDDPLWF